VAYIKTKEHFLNYLNKAIRNRLDAVDPDKFLSGAFYINEIYHTGIADQFTWALKEEGACLLEEKHVLEWIAQQRAPKTSLYLERFAHLLTVEFIKLQEDLRGICGIYCFTNQDGNSLYVGRSISNLGQRILSSFKRFENYNRPVFVKFIETDSAPDAAILEMLFISIFNPPFNKQDNFATEELTLKIEPIPEWSGLTRCNTIVCKEGE